MNISAVFFQLIVMAPSGQKHNYEFNEMIKYKNEWVPPPPLSCLQNAYSQTKVIKRLNSQMFNARALCECLYREAPRTRSNSENKSANYAAESVARLTDVLSW